MAIALQLANTCLMLPSRCHSSPTSPPFRHFFIYIFIRFPSNPTSNLNLLVEYPLVKRHSESMALAQYPAFLGRQLPVQSKHPYLLSVSPKQALPMSNPHSWNKSTSGLEPWDAPQTSWTIDSSYSTLQSAVQPSEPTSSQSPASGAHPLQHPLP